jgi:arsenite-transporting ATPase
MRTLLFTGKGGVGKTTIAASTAVRCADAGLRTLVISTDTAHSLGDAFDRELGPEPEAIVDHLEGCQLDPQQQLEASWGEIRDYLVEVFDWAGVEGVEAEELSVLPGLEELFALTDIRRFAESGDWDVLVVDCAPTAETIRLLSLPEILERYMAKIFPVGRQINRVVAPVLSRVTSLPVAGDNVFAASRRFYERLDGIKALLSDPTSTSIRLVVNPERMVIAEARRTHTYLSLFGYSVDAVVANRLLPDEVTDPWFANWKRIHAAHVAEIHELFDPLPVLRADWVPDEPVGLDHLRAIGERLYADHEPADVLHKGEPLRIRKERGRYVLRLELPFAAKGEVDLARQGDDLLVRLGPYRRSLALPDSLRRREVEGARLRDGVLRITFAGDGAAPTAGPTGRPTVGKEAR